MPSPYPRDLVGYGRKPPHAGWPKKARLALQFVLNYEEGGENSVLHGDAGSEQFLSEIIGARAYPARHLSMESIYEYGSRVGVWRILREFEKRKLPLTVFGVAMALERHPEATAAFAELGHEIASQGWRWIHYQNVDEKTEREHLRIATDIIRRMTLGVWPLGWYTGRDSPNTRRLVVEHGGYEYDSDYYGEELPFWTEVEKSNGGRVPHLVVPYTLDANDMRFATPQGFNTAEQFFVYLRDTFDVLYREGKDAPRMMSVGMHRRLLGRPGRFVALRKFLDHVERHDRVWVCRRIDIARHWKKLYPFASAPQRRAISTFRFPKRPKTGTSTPVARLDERHQRRLDRRARGAIHHQRPAVLRAEHPAVQGGGLRHVVAELRVELAEQRGAHRPQHPRVGVDRPRPHEQARQGIQVVEFVRGHEEERGAQAPL